MVSGLNHAMHQIDGLDDNGYDEKGNKVAVGEYTDGLKTGKWIFFNENSLCEVAYENSKVSSVKNLQKNALANTN